MKTKNLIRNNLGILIAIIAMISFSSGCGKEDVNWIEPSKTYLIEAILVKRDNGVIEDILPKFFSYADRITFSKFGPLGGSGDGAVEVIDDNYSTTNYQELGYFYDPYTGCYYQEWYTYSVVTKKQQINQFRFRWNMKAGDLKNIEIAFNKYDPIIQGLNPNTKSFWESLNKKYTVSLEAKNKGQLVADIISLKSLDGTTEIVLKQ